MATFHTVHSSGPPMPPVQRMTPRIPVVSANVRSFIFFFVNMIIVDNA